MKIERVNENQICCTLTKADLELRQIKLSELAYGSEKAKVLFREMMQQANYELGFEADDIPLMVEAIPMSGDSIAILITKVEYPEELDTRFSRFSEVDEPEYPMIPELDSAAEPQGAEDILDLFRSDSKQESSQAAPAAADVSAQADTKKQETMPKDLVKLLEFSSMERAEGLARALTGFYQGENTLYKDTKQKSYVLALHKSAHSPEDFNKICNIASEYAAQRRYTPAIGAYFEEHGQVLLAGNALEVLAQL